MSEKIETAVRIRVEGAEDVKSAFDIINKSLSKVHVKLGMFLWGAGFGFRIISVALRNVTDQWIESMQRMEQATTRLQMASITFGVSLKELQDAMSKVYATQLFRESDIRLAVSLMKVAGLTTKQIRNLQDVVIGAGLYLGDLAKATQVVTSFIETGNTALLKQIGIYATANDLKEYAILTMQREYKTLSEAERRMLRYNFLLDRSAHLTVYASKMSDTFTASQMRLQASIDQLNTSMGEALIPTLNTLARITASVNYAFLGMDETSRSVIATIVYLVQQLSGMSSTLFYVSSSLLTFSQLMKAFKNVLTYVINETNLTSYSLSNLASNVAMTVTSISGLKALVVSVGEKLSSLVGIISTVGKVLLVLASAVWMLGNMFPSVAYGVSDLLVGFGELIGVYGDLREIQTAINEKTQEYNETVAEMSSTISDYQTRIMELTVAISQLSMQLENVTAVFEKVSDNLANLRKELEDTNKKIADLEDKLARARERLETINERIAQTEHAIERARWDVADATFNLQKAEWKIQEARWRVTESIWKIQDAEYELSRARRDVIRASWRMRDAQMSVFRARTQLMRRTLQLKKIEWELFKLRRDYLDIAREVLFAENRLAIARLRWGEESWEVWEAEQNLRALLERKREAEEKLREKEEEREILLRELQQASYNIEKASRQLTEAMWSMEDASHRLIEAQRDYQRALWDRQKAEWDLLEAIHQREQREHELQEAQWELEEREQELAKLKQERLELEEEIAELEDKLNELYDYRIGLMQGITYLERDYQYWLQQKNTLEEKLNDLMETRRSLYTELMAKQVEYRKKLEELSQELTNLKKKYEDVRDAHVNWLKDVIFFIPVIAGQIADLIKRLGDVRRELDKTSDAFEDFSTTAQNSLRGVVSTAQDVYNQLVGRSIIPDMIDKMIAEFKRGEEMVVPIMKRIVVEEHTGRRARRIESVVNNITVNIHADRIDSNVDEIARQVARAIARQLRWKRGVHR